MYSVVRVLDGGNYADDHMQQGLDCADLITKKDLIHPTVHTSMYAHSEETTKIVPVSLQQDSASK